MKYMKENGVTTTKAIPDGQGAIPNYVGVDDKLVAVLFAMDSPRDNVRRAVNALRYDGVGDIEILTGDMEPQARAVAEQVGVDGFRAQLLPGTEGGSGASLADAGQRRGDGRRQASTTRPRWHMRTWAFRWAASPRISRWRPATWSSAVTIRE